MRTAAVLPVKRFARAKQRLGESVADTLRRELADAMVADVLVALAHTDSIARTVVVTNEQAVVSRAGQLGATVVPDTSESGQSAAAELGVSRALAEGVERVLCVPGDCPMLDPAELDMLLSTHASALAPEQVVIVPDRHGTGTNGLLLAPPTAIAPSFGPDSCERHRALASAAGVSCRVERIPSLLLDIDTGADLQELRARLSEHGAGASHTRAVLARREDAVKTPA